MATGKRFYWIKLKDSFMNSEVVDFLMSQPNGANYVVLYQMLCLKTINTGGRLTCQIGDIIIPFDIEKIQRDCKWFSLDTVRIALGLYKQLGLIYEDRDGTLVLVNHAEMVGSETDWAAKKRRQALQAANSLPAAGESTGDTAGENFPIEIRDKRIENINKINLFIALLDVLRLKWNCGLYIWMRKILGKKSPQTPKCPGKGDNLLVGRYGSAPWRCKPASGQIIQIFFLNQKIGDFAAQGFANQIKLFQRYPVGHLMVKIIDCVSPDSSCVCKLLLSPSLFA